MKEMGFEMFFKMKPQFERKIKRKAKKLGGQ